MNYQEAYDLWIKNVKDESILAELKQMSEEQKQSAFFKELEFGTAGLRGIVGAGSNRMNIYNVAKVTMALAMYLKKIGGKSLAVSYDTRNMSKEFAELVARICAKHDLKVFLANNTLPTPFLSYMVRYYKCDAGVMITASHNPKDYNGYKVYGSDGCQLLEEPSYEIIKIAETLNAFKFDAMSLEEGLKTGVVSYTDEKIFEDYIATVKGVSLNKIQDISVVYTALNGTGMLTLPKVLAEQGAVVNLNTVQCVPDKNFTTCPYPNPEKAEVYETSIELAKTYNADLIIASDPDADRVGAMVRHNGEYIQLNGNEIAIIVEEYLFENKNFEDGVVVKSVVSTGLADKIAEKHGGRVKDVLPGFKYIGEFITNLEAQNKENSFVMGFEESLGYLIGTYIRDKDATVTSMFICEAASALKKQGKTIIDRLSEIYNEFGHYQAYVTTYRFEGAVGDARMKQILSELRTKPPKDFAGFKVLKTNDYLNGVGDMPKADLISFRLEHGIKVMIRPSGTEPLIKVYLTLTETKELNQINKPKLQESFALMFK